MPRVSRKPSIRETPPPPLPRLHASSVVVVGIDPGRNGGVAAIHGRRALSVAVMPTVAHDGTEWGASVALSLWIDAIWGLSPSCECHVFVERAHGFTGDSSGNAFRFGSFYGAVIAAAVAAVGPENVHAVNPRDWQKVLLPGVSGRPELKAASAERARRDWPGLDLFPGRRTKPHDGMADAINICRYGQALLTGTLADLQGRDEPRVARVHPARRKG